MLKIAAFRVQFPGSTIKWDALCYIDLFAGPGKCVVTDTGDVYLGSPLLALTTRYAFTSCFFVDIDPAVVVALETRCQASSVRERVHCFVGDSNAIVGDIVKRIRSAPEVRQSLNLAFLDPEGLELHWRTVARLAQLRTDLIVYYP